MDTRDQVILSGGGMVLVGLIPQAAAACEPLVPLAYVFLGPQFFMLGGMALIGTIAFKCAMFCLFERSLSNLRASWTMLAANVVSTGIGILVAAFIAAPVSLIAFPVVFLCTIIPAGRLQKYCHLPGLAKINRVALAIIFMAFLFLTYLFFGVAMGLQASGSGWYWAAKLAYIYPALLISIGLTTLWEEWIIAVLAGKHSAREDFYGSVLKANLATLFVLMAFAALLALPQRFASPDFLI